MFGQYGNVSTNSRGTGFGDVMVVHYHQCLQYWNTGKPKWQLFTDASGIWTTRNGFGDTLTALFAAGTHVLAFELPESSTADDQFISVFVTVTLRQQCMRACKQLQIYYNVC